MSSLLSVVAGTAVVPAIEANLGAYYEAMARVPGVEVHHTGEMLRVFTGIPHLLYNGAVFAALDPERADAAIDETISYFNSRNVPWLWTIGPGTRPAALGERLQAHGLFYLSEAPGMAADLASLPDLASPAELDIFEVASAAELKPWLVPIREVFELPEEGIAFMARVQQHAGFGPASALRCFIGCISGAPVVSAQLIFAGGVAGVYSVATLPRLRRRGYGTATTLACLRIARECGCRVGVLQSSPMGQPIYERLGFRECCTFRFYAS